MRYDPINMYESKTKKSKHIFNEASTHLPLGVSSNYRYFDPYPIYLSKGKGSRVWDVDGNEYIDFILGFGVMEVGHANPRVVDEVNRAVNDGSILGFEYEKSVELAKIIKNRYNVDMVRFSSTGTEATMHAIRLARAYTRRKKIIKFEGHYHGSHDQLLINVNPIKLENRVPTSLGIPEETLSNTLIAEWNNLDSVEKLVKQNRDDIAGVIMEPVPMNMGLVLPDVDFLKGIFDLADDYGFVVIFDEVKTGGKYFSGASGYYNLKPDIITLGKAIAGGFPLSVIAGKREIMELIGPGKVAHGGTFNANPISVRVAIVTLKEILTEQAFHHMHRLSEKLKKGYEDIAEDLKVDLAVTHWGPSGMIYFSDKAPKNYREFIKLDFKSWFTYFYYMIYKGILPMAGFNEQWTVSVMHTEEEIDKHLEASNEAIKLAKVQKTEGSIFEAF
ncbi:aspartate aminotransferase family protein [Saccharolobus sp. A20]|uniref:aspartate aminotransferase family protein n=2 Tax=Sulfolobaceae TaxID=118883 RepID=UPI000A4EFC2C|nr:aspartate aminotransferase family protein [Sulfolobus sp. A20]